MSNNRPITLYEMIFIALGLMLLIGVGGGYLAVKLIQAIWR